MRYSHVSSKIIISILKDFENFIINCFNLYELIFFCSFQMVKLGALGLKPILFFCDQSRGDHIKHIHLTDEGKNVFKNMQKAYEYLSSVCKKAVFVFFKYFFLIIFCHHKSKHDHSCIYLLLKLHL